MHDSFPYHPYNSSKKDFNTEANKLLRKFIEKYSHLSQDTNMMNLLERSSKNKEKNDIKNGKDKLDTFVFPLLQMRTIGINKMSKLLEICYYILQEMQTFYLQLHTLT